MRCQTRPTLGAFALSATDLPLAKSGDMKYANMRELE